MFVYNIKDILFIAIIIIVVIYYVLKGIIKITSKIGKKNCYKCKYYKLHDVASAGGYCWYKCTKNNRIDSGCSFNNSEHYEKCKNFVDIDKVE